MNQLFGGSICLTELIEQAKKGHSAFSKAQNGKVYCNILTWLNEKEDKYGNIMSHQLSSQKDMREAEGLIYIGNSKALQSSKPVSKSDVDVNLDSVPVRERHNATDDNDSELPF
jgi:hypothetical protein